MESLDDIRIRVASSPRLLRAVRELVRRYLQDLGLTEERRDEVVLAVDEACANAIRHSYGGREDGVFHLSLRARDGVVVVDLRDRGKPADLARIERKRSGLRAGEKLTPGGLGVALMCRVFDRVAYRAGKKCGNRVTMRLNIGSAGVPAAARSETNAVRRKGSDGPRRRKA